MTCPNCQHGATGDQPPPPSCRNCGGLFGYRDQARTLPPCPDCQRNHRDQTASETQPRPFFWND